MIMKIKASCEPWLEEFAKDLADLALKPVLDGNVSLKKAREMAEAAFKVVAPGAIRVGIICDELLNKETEREKVR